jgi:hypothetical protein
MKRITLLPLLLAVVLLPSEVVHADRTVAFKPPKLGNPAERVGGGTRSVIKALAKAHVTGVEQIQLFASNKTGLTSQVAPTLYWNISNALPYDIEITVQQGKDTPLLKKNIGQVKAKGTQSISLADYGVSLVEGKDYTWSIALITDPAKRSNDLVVDSSIRYKALSKPLDDASELSKAGYWYDAVAQLVETNSPQLPSLLNQEGIAIVTSK